MFSSCSFNSMKNSHKSCDMIPRLAHIKGPEHGPMIGCTRRVQYNHHNPLPSQSLLFAETRGRHRSSSKSGFASVTVTDRTVSVRTPPRSTPRNLQLARHTQTSHDLLRLSLSDTSHRRRLPRGHGSHGRGRHHPERLWTSSGSFRQHEWGRGMVYSHGL